MVNALLLVGLLPFAAAYPWPVESASSYAGATSSGVYPPPGATITTYETYFPDEEQVGFVGPTPTGAEPEAIQTAPAAPVKSDTYPLINPYTSSEGKQASFNPMRYWGNLSPWWSVGGAFGLPDTSPQVPEGCELVQVHLVQRHGARYPTSGSGPSEFAALIQSIADSAGFTASGPLEFLNTWTYKLGAEILTPFGRQQLYDLGVAFRVKYGELLNGFTKLPVFRTTSESRMVQSALNWAAGFFGVQEYSTSYYQSIIIEESGYNNSLAPWNDCANANNDIYELGFWAEGNWTEIYLKDAVERLQQHIDGVALDASIVHDMQEMCACETVSIGYSEFCDLFTEEEWKGFEYGLDLEFWYSDGPGNPTGAAQGVGYVQELVARLTQTPITKFDTSINGTLDGNNITFPLDQPIFMDATHDTVIASIATAMNFTTMTANGPLPIDYIPADQTYHTQLIAPFASNLVGQVMSCPVSSGSSQKEKYIRWLLNDGAVPLTGIAHCETPNKDGLCLLENFIEGMQQRIEEVDYQFDCFGSYPLPWPNDPLTNGRPIVQ
ncbi:phosphoglycerate mutase-like protein [Laetiporus sulphureus 93-53]|uniref:Phosphoglycerate mutase-like protein n=1 Tax=Laetiporus sulphureus 93-53 TaxID=1314785 RepID=A0A165EHA0_9APHY|nr:phosphoglycerate mutase-like protein [Laetiporus sulphureus 93-53]KZT07051.1 phosphoglycerate mutase-like protein [Laetiporus sulphureus 93-53]